MDNNPGNWEVNVFTDDSANAFALPGGKIGVNSGLLKVARSQDQLAAVIGHEIGHVMAQHSNERMSIQYATQTGMQMLQALSGEASAEKQQLFALLGLGSEVGIALPFSRKHEAEADLIGLQLMARAGFDPRQSVTLWQNMAAANGAGGLEFLSTHPANDTRINGLQANMSEALALYEQARNAGRIPRCQP
jgi:predicted Zn-dependent protease